MAERSVSGASGGGAGEPRRDGDELKRLRDECDAKDGLLRERAATLSRCNERLAEYVKQEEELKRDRLQLTNMLRAVFDYTQQQKSAATAAGDKAGADVADELAVLKARADRQSVAAQQLRSRADHLEEENGRLLAVVDAMRAAADGHRSRGRDAARLARSFDDAIGSLRHDASGLRAECERVSAARVRAERERDSLAHFVDELIATVADRPDAAEVLRAPLVDHRPLRLDATSTSQLDDSVFAGPGEPVTADSPLGVKMHVRAEAECKRAVPLEQ